MSDCHVDSCFAGTWATCNWAEQHYARTSGCSKLFYFLWHFIRLPQHAIFMVDPLRLSLHFLQIGWCPRSWYKCLHLFSRSYFVQLVKKLVINFTTSCATPLWIWNSPPKNIWPRCSELGCLLVMGSRWGLQKMRPSRRNLVPWRYHLKEMLRCLSLPVSLCLVNIANLPFCHTDHSDTLPQCGLRHNEELTSD